MMAYVIDDKISGEVIVLTSKLDALFEVELRLKVYREGMGSKLPPVPGAVAEETSDGFVIRREK